MDIKNLTQEEYDAAIAAADLVCKTLNKGKQSQIVLPSDVQKQFQVVPHGCGKNCCCGGVVVLPCTLPHYPNYPTVNVPWTWPYGNITVTC